MAEEEIPGPDEGSRAPERERASRRRGLSQEQRRFLNQPRAAPPERETGAASEPPEPPAAVPIRKVPPAPAPEHPRESEAPAEEISAKDEQSPAGSAPVVAADQSRRLIELQHAFLIIGGIVVLGLAFYGGTKFNYLKYLLATRNKPALPEEGSNRFAGLAAEDLVDQALAAERAGHWQDAVDRFLAAKRKNLGYRGILFRVGKILYDQRDFSAADQAFERALAFGENTDAANFYRGLIAVRTKDLAAAEGFFEAAVAAAPFVSDYHYYGGETMRLDLKPKPAEHYYRQAALLARDEQDVAVCQFKLRMARIEAAETEAVKADLARREATGVLSVDWLMTAAAIKIRESHIEEARALIAHARDGNAPGLFASCVNDLYFRDLPGKFPELADVLHLDLDLQVPFPN